jgi:transcriptional regulator of acetoin/glycerol metabolism/DNA-binding CsgD family transcriptional regulator
MPNRDPRLRESLNALLVGSRLVADVRQEILASWRRAARASLLPDALTLPYDPDIELGSRLQREAAPVVDVLATQLAETGTSLILTDAQGRVADRRVSSRGLQSTLDSLEVSPGFSWNETHAGTNAIGTALAQRRPVVVTGGEHFADAFVEMACAGAPITDPRDGQVLGTIALATRENNASPLMLSFLNLASWEIEQRLLNGNPLVERLLYQNFLRARGRTKRPVVVVGEHTMMTNAAADVLLRPDERERVWDWALRALATQTSSPSEFHLGNDVTATAVCEPIYDGNAVVGAIIRLRVNGNDSSLADRRDPTTAERAPLGWVSLSDAESRVVDLVAQGYTNREAAAKLFLSRYTVDSHLRHVFAKLGVSSRTELARVAAEHSARVATAEDQAIRFSRPG